MEKKKRDTIAYSVAACLVVAAVLSTGAMTAFLDRGENAGLESEFLSTTTFVLLDGVSGRLKSGVSAEQVIAELENPTTPDPPWHVVGHSAHSVDITVIYRPPPRPFHPRLSARSCLTITLDPSSNTAVRQDRICGPNDRR